MFLKVQRAHKQDQEQTTLKSSLELLNYHKDKYNSVLILLNLDFVSHMDV